MSSYGKKDGADFGSLTATIAGGSLDTITFSATIASYGVEAGDTIIFDTAAGASAQHLKVREVVSDTVLKMTSDGTVPQIKIVNYNRA